jgi:predicted HicB family RNase H-like nuclease
MEYQGYTNGTLVFDEDTSLFSGQVQGLRDVITFSGKSSSELKRAFRESIDDYLAFCKERGELPERPMSGQFLVRTTPEVHRRLFESASRVGLSFNRFVAQLVAHAVARNKSKGLVVVESRPKAKKPAGKHPKLRKRTGTAV